MKKKYFLILLISAILFTIFSKFILKTDELLANSLAEKFTQAQFGTVSKIAL
tara:strand:+ start:458 stop:613 length:156 start_codon:yes stop_codon:yes gene_type:complete